MPYLPPKEYKPFDKPPVGLRRYKKTNYIFVSSLPITIEERTSRYSTIVRNIHISTYEWWFQYQGKWYMHENRYLGDKKGENFGVGWAQPKDSNWLDSNGHKWEYVHPNQRKVKK
jgi:hypothetical protein